MRARTLSSNSHACLKPCLLPPPPLLLLLLPKPLPLPPPPIPSPLPQLLSGAHVEPSALFLANHRNVWRIYAMKPCLRLRSRQKHLKLLLHPNSRTIACTRTHVGTRRQTDRRQPSHRAWSYSLLHPASLFFGPITQHSNEKRSESQVIQCRRNINARSTSSAKMHCSCCCSPFSPSSPSAEATKNTPTSTKTATATVALVTTTTQIMLPPQQPAGELHKKPAYLMALDSTRKHA